MQENIHIRIPTDAADVTAARAQVRDLLKGQDLPKTITVHIPEGTYSPSDFQFTSEDCSADVAVIYEADEGVIINGGLTIPSSEWKLPDEEMASRFEEKARKNIRMVDLTEYGLSADDWGVLSAIGTYQKSKLYDNAPQGCNNELFCNGKRMSIARYPDTGYAKLDGVPDPGAVWVGGNVRNPAGGAYRVAEDVNERIKKWKMPAKDVWLFGYLANDWADTSSPILEFDTENRIIKPWFYSHWGVREDGIYYLYNIPEELDVPGEWYLDRNNGHLYFYPDKPEGSIDFSYSPTPLINCENTCNMTFKGFTLRCTMSDAIVCTGDDMTFTRLYVSNVYGNAVDCTGFRCTVSDSEITRTGKGGIVLTGGDITTLTPGNNRATNNYIHHFAEVHVTYNPGIKLNGVGNMCDHNEICFTPHMAINYVGNDHLIEYNDIHDAVLHSSDAGSIYAGQSWTAYGTVIRYNRIMNIGGGEFMPDGIYWDDMLSGQTAYRNLIIGVRKHSFMVGGGRCNTIDENVIIDTYYNSNGHLEGHPITYDDRAREGFLFDGGFKGAVKTPKKGYWANFDKYPVFEGVWAEKYPLLARVKTDFETTDPNDKDFPINPAYSSICGNVIVVPKDPFLIWDSVYTYSTVENNHVYSSIDEAKWDEEKQCFTADSPVFKDIPAFKNIPVDEIGRKPIEK